MVSVFVIPKAQRDLDELPDEVLSRVVKVLKNLSAEPRMIGTIKLTGEEGYRFRVGDYRILFRIDDKNKKMVIYRVKHRKEAYR